MLVPGYLKRFRCLGGECPDTCCIGWDVAVDHQTLARYRSIADASWQATLHEALTQVGDKAVICRGDSGRPCVMYSPEGLCLIHQKLGEDALSDICHAYPRASFRFGDRFEQSLALSCPEAARLALEAEDPFDFSSIDLTVRPASLGNVTPVAGFDLATMDEVRALAIQIFQTPALGNAERLVILGLLCGLLDRLAAEGRQGDGNAELSRLLALVESGEFRASLPDPARRQALAANVFVTLLGNLEGRGKSAYQREILDRVRGGLGLSVGVLPTPAALAEALGRGLAAMAPVAALQDELLARFMLNEVFRCVFPWGQGTPLMKGYRYLLLLFGCVRLMQLAVAGADGKAPDRALLARVTQVFCRGFTHDPRFSERADRLLTGAGFDSPEKLFSLI